MTASECPGQADLAAIAGFYAQMTGVLAGFAFTALVFLLTPGRASPGEGNQESGAERNAARDKNGVLLTLLAAFIALLIATLTYSVLAGEDVSKAKGLAATGQLIDGVPFGLAVVMLFQGVTQLMENADVDRVAAWTARSASVVVVPVLAFYYLASGTQDTVSARAGNTVAACTSDRLPGHALALTVALLAVLVVALIPKLQPAVVRRSARRLRATAPIAVLAASIAAAVVSANITDRSPQFLLSPTALDVYIAGTFALFALIGVTLAYSYPAASPQAAVGEAEPTPAQRSNPATPAASTEQHSGKGTMTTRPPAARGKPPAKSSKHPLTATALRQRHDMYLGEHFLSTHMAVVSLALGIASVAAVTLIAPSHKFAGYQGVLWELWTASLLCTALAYAGAMIGAILLPPLIPAVTDLLLPVLLGVLEFLLFAIVGSQVTAFSSVRSVMTAWWFALGGFGVIAALHITRIIHIISHAHYEWVLRQTVDQYLKRLRRDGFAAAVTGALGLAVGTLHAVLGPLPAMVNFAIAGAIVLQLGIGLYFHRVAARGLRRGFAATFDRPRFSSRRTKPVRMVRGSYR